MANILIVEDEAAMGEIIADYMRNGGHACRSAGDGVEAMDILRSAPVERRTTSCGATAAARTTI